MRMADAVTVHWGRRSPFVCPLWRDSTNPIAGWGGIVDKGLLQAALCVRACRAAVGVTDDEVGVLPLDAARDDELEIDRALASTAQSALHDGLIVQDCRGLRIR